jgi:hypothetical protein
MPEERYFQPSSQTMKTTLPSSSSFAIRTAIEAIAPDETPGEDALLVEQPARPHDRVVVGDEDLPVQQREVDDRRDEAVVERAQALHGLALHRLGGDDLHAVAELLAQRRPLPISVPPVPEAGHERG